MRQNTLCSLEENVVEGDVVAPGNTSIMVGEIFEDDKMTLERYEQVAKSKLWRALVYNEQNALKNQECRLIKSTYAYKIKRDWPEIFQSGRRD